MPQAVFSPSSFASTAIPAVFKGSRRAISKGLRKAAEQGKNLVLRNIETAQPRPPIDTGELMRSFQVFPHDDGGWVLRSMAPHAPYMEYGTRAHAAPMAPLRAWARRKLRGGGNKPRRPKVAMPRSAGQKLERAGSKVRSASKDRSVRGAGKAMADSRRSSGTSQQQQLDDAVEALARRAWVSILRRGIRGRGFFAAASQFFPQFAITYVSRELRKGRV